MILTGGMSDRTIIDPFEDLSPASLTLRVYGMRKAEVFHV